MSRSFRFVMVLALSCAGILGMAPGCGGDDAILSPGEPDAALDGFTDAPSLDASKDGAAAASCTRAGEVSCGAACTSLKSDPANCGACGVACSQGQVCN